jgi:hypothetical protein
MDARHGGPLLRSLEATPWANEMIEEFAERAMVGENLGHHAGVDFLTVSFSANDYVGHAVGPDDPAVRDISIRTDILLGKLFDFVEQQAGAGNTLIVLSADHGVAPVPEVNQARHMPGGRLDGRQVAARISSALAERFGTGEWIVPGSPANMPYLNLKLVSSLKLNLADVERVAAAAAAGVDHIARVYTAQDLATARCSRMPSREPSRSASTGRGRATCSCSRSPTTCSTPAALRTGCRIPTTIMCR